MTVWRLRRSSKGFWQALRFRTAGAIPLSCATWLRGRFLGGVTTSKSEPLESKSSIAQSITIPTKIQWYDSAPVRFVAELRSSIKKMVDIVPSRLACRLGPMCHSSSAAHLESIVHQRPMMGYPLQPRSLKLSSTRPCPRFTPLGFHKTTHTQAGHSFGVVFYPACSSERSLWPLFP
jgi:hypothetical protein